jgi:fructose-bisphosphate aldolase class I
MNYELEQTASALVAEGKGILAADETVGTITKRFDALAIHSTEDSRRTYREMLFTTPGVGEFISGVIMYDETIRQRSAGGSPLADVLVTQGIIPGIKVDTGAKPLAGSPEETITEGLDGLPSPMSVSTNVHALARYAALCQEQGLVPIVEPEVLMDGAHSIERCEEVTSSVLEAVFHELFEQCIRPEGMLLKPNMVIAGKTCSRQASVQEVATATIRCLRRHVPAAVPGIVFLSGGQSDVLATAHLNAINRIDGGKPWKMSFSYGRALQDSALATWHGKPENLNSGQEALYHRAKCNGAASIGRYNEAMESQPVGAGAAAHRSDRHDD